MRILSWNVNGLRSIIRKDCLNQIFELEPDVICFQETKLSDLSIFEKILPESYQVYNNLSLRKGQSGVCIITKQKMRVRSDRIGNVRFDTEGRFLNLEFENGWSLINLYFPHGKRDRSDIPYKLEASKNLFAYLMKNSLEKTIICTDFNIAHESIDVARASQNQRNTMFTVEERNVVDQLLELGFVDSFRRFTKESGAYTWWPYGFQARERNVGWRIDYIFTTLDIANQMNDVKIKKEILGSDHCPVIMDIDM